MSGVIDSNGVQWEHCSCCGASVRLADLGYERPRAGHPHGRDVCIKCVITCIEDGSMLFEYIVPSNNWKVVEV